MFDYFIKISSKIKAKGEFYHDMNGYLVSKRKIGERLDYEWTYHESDKINANTYPMCSFGYITDGIKKVIFSIFSWLFLRIGHKASLLTMINC